MRFTKILCAVALVLVMAACDGGDTVVGSLHPLFSEDELVSDPGLVGTWVVNGKNGGADKCTLRLKEAGERAYRLVITDLENQEQTQYEAHVVRLGEYFFLDVVPQEPRVQGNAFKLHLVQSEGEDGTPPRFKPYRMQVGEQLMLDLVPAECGREKDSSCEERDSYELRFTPAHWFFKIRLNGDFLHLSTLNEDWLQKMINQEAVRIEHERAGESGNEILLTASTKDLQEFVLAHVEDEGAFEDFGEITRQR